MNLNPNRILACALATALLTLLPACGDSDSASNSGGTMTAEELRALRSKVDALTEEKLREVTPPDANPQNLKVEEETFYWQGGGTSTPVLAVEQYLRSLREQDKFGFLNAISDVDLRMLAEGEREKFLAKATLRKKHNLTSAQVKEMSDRAILDLAESGMNLGVGPTKHTILRTRRKGKGVYVDTQSRNEDGPIENRIYCRLQENGWRVALQETLAEAAIRNRARGAAKENAGGATVIPEGVN